MLKTLSSSKGRAGEKWAGYRNAILCTLQSSYRDEINVHGKLSKTPTLNINSTEQERLQRNSRQNLHLKRLSVTRCECTVEGRPQCPAVG